MNTLDWVVIAVLLLSIVGAVASGFMMELFHLGGVILGYVLAAWEGWRLAPWFLPYVKSDLLAKACGGIVVFMGVMIIAGIAGKITRWAMNEVGLRWFDRFLGGVFGFVRGVLLCTIGVLAIATVTPETYIISESRTGSYFMLAARSMVYLAPEGLRDDFHAGLERVRKQQQEMVKPRPETSHKPVTPAEPRPAEKK